MLQKLSARHDLYLVSYNESSRHERLKEFGIKKYFKETVFVSAKTPEVFTALVHDASDVVMVGDRIKSEIHIGNQLGFTTVWVQQGAFSSESPTTKIDKPNHIIADIRDLENIISHYEK